MDKRIPRRILRRARRLPSEDLPGLEAALFGDATAESDPTDASPQHAPLDWASEPEPDAESRLDGGVRGRAASARGARTGRALAAPASACRRRRAGFGTGQTSGLRRARGAPGRRAGWPGLRRPRRRRRRLADEGSQGRGARHAGDPHHPAPDHVELVDHHVVVDLHHVDDEADRDDPRHRRSRRRRNLRRPTHRWSSSRRRRPRRPNRRRCPPRSRRHHRRPRRTTTIPEPPPAT